MEWRRRHWSRNGYRREPPWRPFWRHQAQRMVFTLRQHEMDIDATLAAAGAVECRLVVHAEWRQESDNDE